MNIANDKQVAGQHYESTVQHWDYATYMFGTGYLRGQVTKYLCRWRKKNGLQDLEKALHFLQKLREVAAIGNTPVVTHAEFVRANAIPAEEAEIIALVAAANYQDLARATDKLEVLIAHAKAEEPQAHGYVKQDAS